MKHLSSKILIQIVFVSMIGVLLIGSMVRALLFPKEINYYENRKANQLSLPTPSDFMSAEFQDSMESALADQVFFAEAAKMYFNTFESNLSFPVLEQIYLAYPNRYFVYNDILVFNRDYLLFRPRKLTQQTTDAICRKVDSIHAASSAYPEIDFFAYYIEKDTDINFETGEKAGVYDYLQGKLNPELCKSAYYPINSFSDFSQKFYQTDHHWNHRGSYEGYLQVCELLGITDPLPRGEEFSVGAYMEGSKIAYAKNTRAWSESMDAYFYSFPHMEITVNGQTQADYGQQNQIYAASTPLTYGAYYGGDMGEVIFDTGNKEQKNILIIGESYDNAIIKLLASHYNRLHSIDLRYYAHYMGETFDFASYVEENQIDQVLLIGNIDFYIMDEFNIRLGGE